MLAQITLVRLSNFSEYRKQDGAADTGASASKMTGGKAMLVLVLGLVLFLGVHSVRIAAPQFRDRVVGSRGLGAWKGIYSLAAFLGLVLIVWGYWLARQNPVVLYTPATWMQHLTLLLMLPVFPLMAASHRPGRISTAVGHPMLLGTVIWGLAHLLANGTLADLLLFGGIAVWGTVDWVSSVQRPREPVAKGKPSPRNDVMAVVGGLVIYAIFVAGLHRLLFGVSPI